MDLTAHSAWCSSRWEKGPLPSDDRGHHISSVAGMYAAAVKTRAAGEWPRARMHTRSTRSAPETQNNSPTLQRGAGRRCCCCAAAAVLLLLCCCCCAAAAVLLLLLHDPRWVAEHSLWHNRLFFVFGFGFWFWNARSSAGGGGGGGGGTAAAAGAGAGAGEAKTYA